MPACARTSTVSGHFSTRSLFQGGTVFDVFVTTTAAAVGQSILVLPTTLSRMGIWWGIAWQIMFHSISTYTGYLLSMLYLEYCSISKQDEEAPASGTSNVSTVQYDEVVGGLTSPQFGYLTRIMTTATLFGLATVQFIASSSNLYLVSSTLNKQQWTFVFGAITTCVVFLPSIGHYRALSILGLLATTYTAIYLFWQALANGQVDDVDLGGPQSATDFFEGSSDVIFTFSGHAMLIEVMFTMDEPAKFGRAFTFQWVYVMIVLTLPHSIAVWWAFGAETLAQHNAIALMPESAARTLAAMMMVLHELVACGLFLVPLFTMAEKACAVHHEAEFFTRRVPVRLVVFGASWFVAIALPFFGPANAVIGALLSSNITYMIPCAVHLWVYRTAKRRQACALQLWQPRLAWPLMIAVNVFTIVLVTIMGFGFGSFYSIRAVVDEASTFGIFQTCYECGST
mmetsp:Transcript_35419/g.92973  ORF Transcript_35419/g.92973 Transcript_35419/m.92973 type:complete len:455 (+) Transcript_35419:102-1466(+)